MGFKDELTTFQNEVIQYQSNPESERIYEEDAIVAINVLNYIRYNKVPDVFLGCAAYNMLNVFAKQKDNQFTCHFHHYINTIIKGIEDVCQPKTIKITFDNSDKLNLLIISFWDFQFSFQCIQYNDQIKNLSKNNQLRWDEIRKQKCARTIFYFALSNSWISNQTLVKADLRKLIESEIQNYYDSGYKIADGRIVKTKKLIPAKDIEDPYLKNYLRTKLISCQDRPVIISAVFRKVWDKHITFTAVKPYISGTKVITICDHINLFRPDVESVIDINSLVFGQRYYIIGYCEPYKYSDRMGVRLAINEGFIPIFGIKEYERMPKDIESRCHRFSIEEYLSSRQKKFKY